MGDKNKFQNPLPTANIIEQPYNNKYLVSITIVILIISVLPNIHHIYYVCVCIAGIFSMMWLLFLRYYLIAKMRRKALILSVKEMTDPATVKQSYQSVPWMTLFSKSAFW